MFRFSHFAVATGHVPSTGKALTGSRSPFPASITAVTFCTKSGACSDTSGATAVARAHRGRHRNLMQVRERLIDDLAVPPHDLRAALAVGLLDGLLDLRNRLIARQQTRDREEARLHDRVDARPHAGTLCQVVGVDSKEADPFLDDLLLQLSWQVVPHASERRMARSAETPRPERHVRARRSCPRTRIDDRPRSWRDRRGTPTGLACLLIRRCETVIAPDFFES